MSIFLIKTFMNPDSLTSNTLGFGNQIENNRLY